MERHSHLRVFPLPFLIVALVVALGCGDNGTKKDASLDGDKDGVTDGALDKGADGAAEAGLDSGKDVTTDSGLDVTGDVVADTGQDSSNQDGSSQDGLGTDGGGSDTAPPATLTATVVDRRQTSIQLAWTSPAGVGTIAGYQVRYAKVAITAANFSDTAVTTSVPYTGTPSAPGTLDGSTVRNLYIETGYYFAVAATNSGGTQVWMQATSSPVAAHFNLSSFPSTAGTNEELGYSLSAVGDLNGDGHSDILAGTYQGGRAYLFFGSTTVAGGSAGVVFSSSNAGFGNSVAQIGDVDHDGLPDVAIADPINAAKVYIYKGRRTWPMTLTDAQADYVIGGDATYTGTLFGTSLTALGDFTGDGVDDFAIGARGFATAVGRVVIIPGKASGFASVTLPDAANAIIIDGDSALGRPTFGYRVLGIGHFYSVSTGTTLVVSSPGAASATTANMGHVYVFHGQAGTGGTIALSSADQSIAGAAMGMRIGLVLSNLGPLLGSLPAVGVGNPADTVGVSGFSGTAYASHGTATTGPLSTQLIVSLAGGTGVGGVVVGGGLPGRDGALSLIGDASPDFVIGAETGSTLAILDGAKLASKTAPVDAAAVAEVKITLPTGWFTGESAASLIPDINGDGVPDICVGNSFTAVPGSVAVYW